MSCIEWPLSLTSTARTFFAAVLAMPVLLSAAPPATLPLQIVDQAGMPLNDAVIEIARPAGDARAR